ncbi:MAG: glycosyltransferase [Alphaproteobacteria bacterium]
MKLAVIGSYNEACGVASYVSSIKNCFGAPFDVEVMDLKTTALVGHETLSDSDAAEAHIDSICKKLKHFDCVNLQFEGGLFGRSIDVIGRRLTKLFNNSQNLILTIHSLHVTDQSRDMLHRLFQNLKNRSPDRPYWFITHLQKEADILRQTFGIDNVIDFPVTYFTEQQVKDLHSTADAKAWKRQIGLKEDDIVVLHAGFFAAHKDHMTALKALQILPQNYKLVFAGSEHPVGIQKFSISPVVSKITDYIDQYDADVVRARNHDPRSSGTTLGDRVRFVGAPSDADLHKVMCCADIVAVTHLESGQSSSGIASMAFQLERPVILSYNIFFLEYEKYYKDGFSYFTMGNHYELRDKIMNFDMAMVSRLQEYGKTYSMDGLAKLYQKIYDDMRAGRVINRGRPVVVVALETSRSQPIEALSPQYVNTNVTGIRLLIRKIRSFIRRVRIGFKAGFGS